MGASGEKTKLRERLWVGIVCGIVHWILHRPLTLRRSILRFCILLLATPAIAFQNPSQRVTLPYPQPKFIAALTATSLTGKLDKRCVLVFPDGKLWVERSEFNLYEGAYSKPEFFEAELDHVDMTKLFLLVDSPRVIELGDLSPDPTYVQKKRVSISSGRLIRIIVRRAGRPQRISFLDGAREKVPGFQPSPQQSEVLGPLVNRMLELTSRKDLRRLKHGQSICPGFE